MMHFTPIRLAAAVLVACAACSSIPTVSGATDSVFAGTWAQREAVTGTSFVLKVAVDGATVAATGTYTTEGRSGTLTAKGDVTGEVLQLAITCDNGELAQVEGRIVSAKVMSGTLHFGDRRALTASAVVTFDKKD